MPQSAPRPAAKRPRVGLFVTCLVDLFRPSVGFAAVKLLEDAGCDGRGPAPRPAAASPPSTPATIDTRETRRDTIAAFSAFDYVVVPSGSCAGMMKAHYPELFAGDPAGSARAQKLAAKTFTSSSPSWSMC